MRWMLIGLAVVVSMAQDQPYTPPAGHGPYSGRPGWHCYKGDTREDYKLVHCACKQICDVDDDGNVMAREDGSCLTFCTSKQCTCHVDSDECQH